MTRIERIICFLSLGSWCAYKAYRSSQEEVVRWDWLTLLIIGIVALLIFTWIARKDSARQQGLKLPTLPGTVFALTIAGLFFLQNNKRQWQADTLALDHQDLKKDSLTILDHAKADKALQTWLVRRSPLLHTQFRQTSFHATNSFAHKP
jgi:cytochrome bd-type quinol oxidase subunit 2